MSTPGPTPFQPRFARLPHPPAFRLPMTGETIDFQGHVYTMGPEIGQGAFGRVFECTDEWGNNLAAKVIIPQGGTTQEETSIRWHIELRNLIDYRHPNITHIYDAFVWQNAGYLIMERCCFSLQNLYSPRARIAVFARIASPGVPATTASTISENTRP